MSSEWADLATQNPPSGSDWHYQLIARMVQESPSVRPAVIQAETGRCLDEFRRFRHVVRSVYALNLKPERVQELAAELPACHHAVLDDLLNFADFLERLASASDTPSSP